MVSKSTVLALYINCPKQACFSRPDMRHYNRLLRVEINLAFPILTFKGLPLGVGEFVSLVAKHP